MFEEERMDATAPVTGRGGGLVVSRGVEDAFRGYGRSFAYEMAHECERLLGIAVEVRRDPSGNLLLSGRSVGPRLGRIEGFIRRSPLRERHFQEWSLLRHDIIAVLRPDAIQATARPMTAYESRRLGASPFGHSLATPGQVLVDSRAAAWRLVSRGGAHYPPPTAIGAMASDSVAVLFMVAHELGHDGRLGGISSLGEEAIIRRINGCYAALGLPIRSGRMAHSSLFVYPNELVPEDDRALFNYSPR